MVQGPHGGLRMCLYWLATHAAVSLVGVAEKGTIDSQRPNREPVQQWKPVCGITAFYSSCTCAALCIVEKARLRTEAWHLQGEQLPPCEVRVYNLLHLDYFPYWQPRGQSQSVSFPCMLLHFAV